GGWIWADGWAVMFRPLAPRRAALLLGHNLSASIDPPPVLIEPARPLAALLILVVWMVAWYLVIRRWQRGGELPLRGMRRFWHYVFPLGGGLCVAPLAWLVVPRPVYPPPAN